MYISKIILENYKRLINGLGQEKIVIDFSNMNRIIRFAGHNGSGKSTILNALSPLPDYGQIVQGKVGKKDIYIVNDDGTDAYIIKYSYMPNAKGTHSIQAHIINSKGEDLNVSGNVSEAKNLVFNIFGLDNNFEALTKLSAYGSENLAMMRPSERKKFISSIIDNLAVYNDIYKTLSKRSSIFKSMINSINNKISNIGNTPEKIVANIANTEKNLESLKADRDKLLIELSKINMDEQQKAKNNMYKEELFTLMNSPTDLTAVLNSSKARYDNLIKEADADMYKDKLDKYYTNLSFELNKLTSTIDELKKEQLTYMELKNSYTEQLNFIKDSELYRAYNDGETKEETEKRLEGYKTRIKFIFGSYDNIDFYANELRKYDIDSFIKMFNAKYLSVTQRERVDRRSDSVDVTKDSLADILKYKRDNIYPILGEGNINDLIDLEDIDYDIYYRNDIVRSNNIFKELEDFVYSYFNNRDFVNAITTKKDGVMSLNLELIDICKEYNHTMDNIEKVEESLSKIDKITEMKVKAAVVNQKLINLETSRKENNRSLLRAREKHTELNKIANSVQMALQVKEEIDLYEKSIKDREERIEFLNSVIIDTSNFDSLNIKLNSIENMIKLNEDELYKSRYSLNLIEEYMAELKIFNDKYNYVETLKHYSSPTTGIQIAFLDLYMNKILSMANEMISHLFNGEFVLQPFVITDTEFSIPVQTNGLMVDDISSLSASQMAMINMCISLAIFTHAYSNSTLRVIRLDEIDTSLDSENRANYPKLLFKILSLLNCNQCFMISHNNEFTDDEISVINLDEGGFNK